MYRRDCYPSVPGLYGDGDPQCRHLLGAGQATDAPAQVRRVVPRRKGAAAGRGLSQHPRYH